VISDLLNRLTKVRTYGEHRWMACCPAHDDKTPSLAVQELRDGRILIHCYAGCGASDVMAAIGLTLRDLFPEGSVGEFEGWEQWQNKIKANKEDSLFRERALLFMCETRRKNGERIGREDLEAERLAYLKLRSEGLA